MRILYLLFFLSFSLLFSTQTAIAQNGGVANGRIVDSLSRKPLEGVTVLLLNPQDGKTLSMAESNKEGVFRLPYPIEGRYRLVLSMLGFDKKEMRIKLPSEADINIVLRPSSAQLKDVNISANQIRVEQKGDTTQYNADAYKVNKDATAEDLVTKMPGITVENGVVKAQGEEVKKVLVDGKEFFGDDASTALRNLPAEIVDRVQVYDRWSDQAMFTGFDDGNSNKAINIQTKRGKANGKFGRISGGLGTDQRYNVSGAYNVFNGDRRLTFIGQSNNINQQNFSFQDILGVFGGGGGGRGMGMMGGMGGRRGGMGGMMGGGGMGGVDPSTFFVGQQNGISTTHAFGLNFSDQWGPKLKVNGSLFTNYTENGNSSETDRNYFSATDTALRYNETGSSSSINRNHRFSMRLEYTIDTLSSIIFTPKVTLQNSISDQFINGQNSQYLGSDFYRTLSGTQSGTGNFSEGFTLGQNFLYRRRLNKPGRTLSINFSTDWNNKYGDGNQNSLNSYRKSSELVNTLIQKTDNNQDGLTLGTTITYTEPIGKNGQISLNYNPSWTLNHIDKTTFNNTFNRVDTALSNRLGNHYDVQRVGGGYRYNYNRLSLLLGFTLQNAQLVADQAFPTAIKIDQGFNNILPNAQIQYKFNTSSNIRIIYRTNTNVPSVSQLQNVVNNSNPLLLSSGNPNLQQDFSHNLVVRYGKSNALKGSSFFVFMMSSYTQNYIGNQTLIPVSDSIIQNNIRLRKGSQLTIPVNMDGYFSNRTFITYGFPIKWIKCNLNLNAGLTYTRTPGMLNQVQNFSDNYGITSGFVLGSNISEKLDFTLSYSPNFNIVRNSAVPNSNSDYYYHSIGLRFNWQFWKGLLIGTQLTNTRYSGLSQGFDQNYTLVNPFIAYKFLKNQAMEIRFSVFDLLNQNNNVSRNVTETYIEDNISRVLKQYYMLTLSFNIRKFKIEGGFPGMGPGGPGGPGGAPRMMPFGF